MKGEIGFLDNLLSVPSGSKAHEKHNKILAAVVRGLYKENYKELNYDHIKIEIPKKDIPLQIDERKYDVVVKISRDEYAFIEISVLKSWQLQK